MVDFVTVVTVIHELSSAQLGSRQRWSACVCTPLDGCPTPGMALYQEVVHLRNGFLDVFAGPEANWCNLAMPFLPRLLSLLCLHPSRNRMFLSSLQTGDCPPSRSPPKPISGIVLGPCLLLWAEMVPATV